MKDITPEIFLEKRRAKKNGLYPVKLRIIYNRIAKYYPVNVDLSEEQFAIITSGKKPPAKLASQYSKIYMEHGKVLALIKSMPVFDFHSFEKKLYSNSYGTNSVKQYFTEYIGELKKADRIGTSDSYTQALNSLLKYQLATNKHKDIQFSEITTSWLHQYERYMVQNGFSYATVGVYLRTLRAIYNIAIDKEEVNKEQYPFGKRKYEIPATTKRKKALSKEELIKLFTTKPLNSFQEKARDFWYFSFYCNGMNISDIVRLKWTNIEGDKIYFVRTKTKNTSKANQTEIVVHINSFISDIIEKYGSKKNSPYVFDIISLNDRETDIKHSIKTFTRFINQHIKKLAEEAGVNAGVSTVWARHTFTTSVIRMGGSMEFVQESLGHKNINTTMNYWAGFNHDYKEKISEQLLQITQ